MKKGLGIGRSDFKKIIEDNCYYFDKTKFIEDIIKDKAEVKLFTRPRRFGKTLNLSMLKYFFDIEKKEENREIKFYMKSSSLTWIGTAKQGDDGMERIYLSKIPYTSYAKDKNTFNFMNGLEQRYGVEKSGEMKLEVKANDYCSIKPEAGAELIFKYSFGSYKTVKAVLSAAYENDLGKIADGRNQAKVADTSAGYFNIRGEKENREGNIKTDLKIGVDNSRVGLTANVGYDTKVQNIRGGVGVRFIF